MPGMVTMASAHEPSANPSSTSAPSFRSRMVGTWDLCSYVAVNIDNREDIVYPLGKEAKGQIMYSNDGYMSVLLQHGSLKPFKHDWKRSSIEESATVAQATMTYAGPYY